MNTKMMMALAQNKSTPSDVLDGVHAIAPSAILGHSSIHINLASHPNASRELIGHLLKHSDPLVASTAAEHLQAKYHYGSMHPNLQLYAQLSRHAPKEIHDEIKARARTTYGPTLAKHGWQEVPMDKGRMHPGRVLYVHPKDSRLIQTGIIKMGSPFSVKRSFGRTKEYTKSVPVLGWRRFGATDISAPRGSDAISLDTHLNRVKKNYPLNQDRLEPTFSNPLSWNNKMGNYRVRASAHAKLGHTESRIDKLLAKVDQFLGLTEDLRDDDPLKARGEELHDKHIPASGPAAHLEGELHRASSRIHHDYTNNGFGNNWSGAHNLLRRHQDMLAQHEPGVKQALDHLAKWKNGAVHKDHQEMFNDEHPTMQAVRTLSRATIKALDVADKTGHFGQHPGDLFDYHNRGCKCEKCQRKADIQKETGMHPAAVAARIRGTEDIDFILAQAKDLIGG